MTTPVDHPDALEASLRDLGAHLDLGPADGAALADAVQIVIGESGEPTPIGLPARAARRRPPRWLVAAAAVVVALVGLMAVAPARDAVAGWLGIGAVEIRPRSTPPATDDLPDRTDGPTGPVDAEALERDLPFPLRLLDPDRAGAPLGAAIDPDVDAGLVEVRYRDVTLVAVGLPPDGGSVVGKELGPGTEITTTSVGGRPGLWLAGDPHQVAYRGPDGAPLTDSVRRAGDVLLWQDGGVTYRIEGAASLDAALTLAESLR